MSRLWLTWFLAIVFFIVFGMFLSSREANAETMFAQNEEGDRITLFEAPCTNGRILAVIEKAFLNEGEKAPTDLQSGEVRFVKEGTFPICWRLNNALQIGFVYEDGDAAAVPLLSFKPEEQI